MWSILRRLIRWGSHVSYSTPKEWLSLNWFRSKRCLLPFECCWQIINQLEDRNPLQEQLRTFRSSCLLHGSKYSANHYNSALQLEWFRTQLCTSWQGQLLQALATQQALVRGYFRSCREHTCLEILYHSEPPTPPTIIAPSRDLGQQNDNCGIKLNY